MLKSRMFYMIALIALSLFYIYCNSYTPIFIIIIFISLTVFGIVCTAISKSKISIEIKPTQPFSSQSENKNAEFSAEITNNSIFPISAITFELEFQDMTEDGVIKRRVKTAAAAKEKRSVYTVVATSHSACIECRLKKAGIYDPFGLVRFKIKNVSDKTRLLITPIMSEESYIGTIGSSSMIDSDKFSDTQKGDDSSQVFEIRNYRPGDDIRRIHWRLSSKQDDLIVKEYSKPIDEDCVVMLETGIGSSSAEEKKSHADSLLSVFMKLSFELLGNEQAFSVLWYSENVKAIISFDVRTFEDISPIIEKFLSEKFPQKRNLTINMSEDETDGFGEKQVYYLYNSSCFDDDMKLQLDERYNFIDTAAAVKA